MTSRAEAARPAPKYLRWFVGAGLASASLSPLAGAWNSATDMGHGWLTPLLLAYLWWERWSERPPVNTSPKDLRFWTFVLAMVALALLPVRLLLIPYPFWPSAVVVHTGSIVAASLVIAWLHAGRAGVRWFGSPLVLLIGAIPWPSSIDTLLILPLREGMALLAAEISNLLGRPAMATGTSIRLASGWVGIDEACGGIRSLQACVLIGLFFGEWFRLDYLRRSWLVGAAALAAIVGNFARVLFLSFRGGAEAIARAHDFAGWAALLLSMFATGLLAWIWAGRRLPLAPQSLPDKHDYSPVSPIWRVAAVFVAILLSCEIGARLWFSIKPPISLTSAQWEARFPVGLESFQSEPLSAVARDLLRPDAFAAGRWRIANDETVAAYYVEWRKGQVARSIPFLHNPTVCLPMSGCELIDAQPELEIEVGSLRIPFQTYRFRRLDREIFVAFTIWDPTTLSTLKQADQDWGGWFTTRWKDVATAKKHQPAQLLSVSIPWNDYADQNMRNLLTQMIQQVKF